MSKTINVVVKDKIAATVDDTVYICGNSDFVIVFDFDEGWEEHTHKTARFVHNGMHQDIVFHGNECAVPVMSNTHNFMVGVYAGDLVTTTPAYVPATKSILCGTTPPTPPPPDVYAQMVALFQSGLDEGRVNANRAEEAASTVDKHFTMIHRERLRAEEAAGKAESAQATSETIAKEVAQAKTDAEVAQKAAEEAKTKAETAQNAAETAETNAAKSASNAEMHKNSASNYETYARNSATKAENAAESAAASEKAAKETASGVAENTAAAKQAKEAAVSALTGSQTAEKNAKQSEVNAKAAESNAQKSAEEAKQSLQNIGQAESNAEQSAKNAASSESGARESRLAAEQFAKDAKDSADDAATSEANASNYTASALQYRNDAERYANSAGQSATAAESSAQAAKGSETAAKTSETNAGQSEQKAKASETAANTAQVNAKKSEETAKTSEQNAKSSETNSAKSASAASLSERNAKQSETTAANKAGEAEQSAANADTSAKNAKSSETAAAASAVEANEAAKRAGGVQTVNGQAPDANGNVEVEAGGVSDWNINDPEVPGYIKNRTHWTEGGLVELLNVTAEVDPDSGAAMLSERDIDVKFGDMLVVNYNGTEYTCEVLSAADFAPEGVELPPGMWGAGNIDATIGTGDSGHPFILQGDKEQGVMLGSLDGSATVSVTISVNKTTIHKVPLKYLPEGVGYTENGLAEILPKVAVDFSESEQIPLPVDPPELVAGETYIVTWNGTEYECMGRKFNMPQEDGSEVYAGVYLGDLGSVMGGDSTGEPFVIVVLQPNVVEVMGVHSMVSALDGSTSATVSIVQKGEIIRPVPGKFLPEGLPYVEYHNEVVLPESEIVDYDYGGHAVLGPFFELEHLVEYEVIYNGTKYDLIAIRQDSGSLDGFSDTGLGRIGSVYYNAPFTLAPATKEVQVQTGVCALLMLWGDAQKGTISIVKKKTYGKIAPKSLPGNASVFVCDFKVDKTNSLKPVYEAQCDFNDAVIAAHYEKRLLVARFEEWANGVFIEQVRYAVATFCGQGVIEFGDYRWASPW